MAVVTPTAIPKVAKVRVMDAAVGVSLQVRQAQGHVVLANKMVVINLVLRVLRAQAVLRVRVVEVRKLLERKLVRVAPQVANSFPVLSKVVSRPSIVSLAKVDQEALAVPAVLLAQAVRVAHLNKGEGVGRVQVQANQVVDQSLDPAILPPDRHLKGTIGSLVVPPRMSLD